MIQPRPYQRTSIDQLYTWFRANPVGNPLLVLPTGSGKSIILATLIQEALANWPQTRILMLTHVRELIAQNADKLRLVWPAVDADPEAGSITYQLPAGGLVVNGPGGVRSGELRREVVG